MPSGIKQAFAARLTDVDSVQRDQLGTLRFEGNKVYKYCKLKNTTATVAVAAGTLLAYLAATGYGSHTVVSDHTDADAALNPAGAAVAVAAGVAGTEYFIWVQVKGPATLDTAVTTGAAGSPFHMTAADKSSAIDSAATQASVGVSMNATTGVILDCPF